MTLELPSTMTELAFESTGILYGVKGAVSKDMKPFIREISPSGNPIFDPKMVLDRLAIAGQFLKRANNPLIYATDGRFVNALINFHLVTGYQIVKERLYAGALSNPQMKYYIDCDVLLVADPANGMPTKIGQPFRGDRRVMDEASSQGIPVVAICNSNASLQDVDLVIPANNVGVKAIATIFYILATASRHDDLKTEIPPIEAFETIMTEEEVEEEE